MKSWMRWANAAGWLLVAGLAVLLWQHIDRQEKRIDALRRDLSRVEDYLPTLLRSEFSAHETRMLTRIQELMVRK